jgi:hypothetical protein
LWPEIHGHQKKSLAMLVLGIVLSGSAVLQRVAESLFLEGSSAAKMTSIERRLARFVAKQRIEVSRVLPLAWCVMPAQEKWDQGPWQIVGRLLERVRPYLAAADCTLLADRGLACFALVQLCRSRQWHYLLRVCKEHPCRRWLRGKWGPWTAFNHWLGKPGQQWFGRMLLWQEDTIDRQVSALWEPGQQEAWLEPGGELECRSEPTGPPAAGTLSGDVVGRPFGSLLHPSGATRALRSA